MRYGSWYVDQNTLGKNRRDRLKRKLRAAIRRLVRAELDKSWSRGGDPDTWDDIDRELVEAKRHISKVISEVL